MHSKLRYISFYYDIFLKMPEHVALLVVFDPPRAGCPKAFSFDDGA
jgi:tRNA/tmRNA/rRNA uracil-C5-methylase (TrmA/RlmC/RlmD family)